jgi:hypothetical protein
MPTRSTCLGARSSPAGTWTPLWTVPNGYTYIAKGLIAYNGGGVGDTTYVRASDPNGTYSYFWYATALAVGARLEWAGWFAMNPGQTMEVYSANGTVMFWASGAKLPGVA